MTPKPFIHLHLHSEFSLIDGIVRIDELLDRVVELAMPAVALTDYCNLFAAVKFYQAAMDAGVKPIFGAELNLQSSEKNQPHSRIVLLCLNHQGYLNLIQLISKAYTAGQHEHLPLISKNWLAQYSDGLLAIIPCLQGDLPKALFRDQTNLVTEYLQFWQTHFANRFYLEITSTERQEEAVHVWQIIEFAQKHALPIVASNDVRFLHQDDFEAHEVRVCVHDGTTLEDDKRLRLYSKEQYLKSSEQMYALFADIPQALANTIEIAKRCNVNLDIGKVYLPNFPIPNEFTVENYLISEAKKGLEERLKTLFNNNENIVDLRKPYDERLDIELSVINKMGFAGYFLIVADFIRWASENDVPVGPGRGSGAGSLVAYSLKITGLDPLQFDLLFERFLNPERISMPDFDIDFCMDGRDRVIDYVVEKYGHESVAQIITFGTMAAKAVVRDVGRALGHPYGFVDKIAKLIPFELGITLEKALAQEDQLRDRYRQEEEVKTLIDLAKKLEGISKNAGKHAGGVVISPSKITDFTPIYCESMTDTPVTQFDKDDVEAIGLVKFDFLGLRTLTIIDWALKSLSKTFPEQIFNIETIPLEDEKTFTLLKDCKTTGVFQLESRGMKELIKRLQPDCFEEIVALVALFRPGPLQSGMVDDFIQRKHGLAQIEYLHPDLEPILKPTYGVILYQEQVMQIAQVLAGYTLGSADILRRAMGKKKAEEMAKQRAIFTEGCIKQNISEPIAKQIFDLMEKFAGYGFNKSHSAAYALVSYQTAWLKTHYPAAFMSAVLSSDMDNTDKVVNYLEEAFKMDLKIISPDINRCEYAFTVQDEHTIVYGLGAIKGAGLSAIEIIVNERNKNGPFKSLFDLCNRIDLRKVNKRVLEPLIKSGAMDSFQLPRATLFASIESALRQAEKQQKNKTIGQLDIFMQSGLDIDNHEHYVKAIDWTKEERLQGEKDTLGLYFSGHPLDIHQEELTQFSVKKIQHIDLQRHQQILVAGLIYDIRVMLTKNNDKMAFVTLDDGSGRFEFVLFSDLYASSQPLLVKDQLLIVSVEISHDEYSGRFRTNAKRLLTLDQARELYAKYLLIEINDSEKHDDIISELQTILLPFKQGHMPVVIDYKHQEAHFKIELGQDWFVFPHSHLLKNLKDFFGDASVRLCY